jgi:hypothetical protein
LLQEVVALEQTARTLKEIVLPQRESPHSGREGKKRGRQLRSRS